MGIVEKPAAGFSGITHVVGMDHRLITVNPNIM
jgi:hypothetical protein